ncbi:rieske [2Fe-2S] isoform A [Micractinium conductrix]|uniref:Rieske [2Fe-2S] isoform A n=1 Tax=Micractinium conductrix TaxID=554055 RepID=A0A2P6VB25_9CHLO|nr:rieske [2Fe-2S] isoform A [Micractinium conductrix]|eukprot:PSC71275.1 rieske [2Fe-2S] isoform A [Micractinium conductrix]
MSCAASLSVAAPVAAAQRPAGRAVGAPTARAAFRPACRSARCQRVTLRAIAQEPSVSAASSSSPPAGFVPVLRPEDLPKGTRKEVRAEGKTVLLFWYRNQINAIEARSPAEGAYSEGFIRAKFTQDYCIECPGTGTLFSLKDGSIVSWYPSNPVLRMLTPKDTCRTLEIYPVHLGESAISVNVSGSTLGGAPTTRGGSDTSLENNNVYGLEPKVYVEGSDELQQKESSSDGVATAATTVITVLAVVGSILGGGATFMYFFGP